MGVADFFGSLKNKAYSVYNKFFYDGGEAPASRGRDEYPNPPQEMQQPMPGQQPQWQYAQAPVQQPYNGYQQQNMYQQQNAYQQPAYQPVSSQQVPQQAPHKGRAHRTQHASMQQESGNVFYINSMLHGRGANDQIAEQSPQEEEQNVSSLLTARVINARGMADCRSAITLLRNGDAVVIVLENVTEPTEMRRLVDTLSGACYSLTATITKVSRYGVYLLAPQSLAVFADQATNTMNNAPVRQNRAYQQQPYQAQRPAYSQGQASSYARNGAGYQQPQQQNPYAYQQLQNPYDAQQGAFTQRSAQQEETAQDFYQRPTPRAAATVGFSAQPAAYGYAPDEAAAGDQ